MPITIAGLEEAKRIGHEFDVVISITDDRYVGVIEHPNHIHVAFEDTEHPTDFQFMDMLNGINRIFKFVEDKRLDGSENILVHCHAGVSRSAAIAWALLVKFGETDYKKAFQELYKRRSSIWPNVTVIQIADNFLGCDGAFYKVATIVNGEIGVKRQSSGYC